MTEPLPPVVFTELNDYALASIVRSLAEQVVQCEWRARRTGLYMLDSVHNEQQRFYEGRKARLSEGRLELFRRGVSEQLRRPVAGHAAPANWQAG